MKLLNRELSWLQFNLRVSDEAKRKDATLGDRVLFHGITGSNLDEFLQVRYPIALNTYSMEDCEKIQKAIEAHYLEIHKRFEKFNKDHQIIRSIKDLKNEKQKWFEKKFKQDIFPTLQPITIDKSRQYNLRPGTYLLVFTKTKDDDRTMLNYIELPKMISRFIQVPDKLYCIDVLDLIQDQLKYIFKDRKIVDSFPFTILRSAEVYQQSDTDVDPLEMIRKTLHDREQSWITCMEVGVTARENLKMLKSILHLSVNTLVLVSETIKLSDLKKIPQSSYEEKERITSWKIYNTVPKISMFDYIKKEDRLINHPYESYETTMVRFLQEAADDPNVVSIKISLYRVSDNSKIIQALLRAADHGKIVTVLIELKARFDERHNIEISRALQEGGVRIVYTKPNIKTHAKVCLVTRQEKKGLRIYYQVGTGNYSESNSKQYQDYSYFGADQDVGYDLTRFFNLLTSDQEPFKSQKIIYAPYNMRESISELIDQEVRKAKKGKAARILVKCNAFADDKLAEKFINAAKAGVKIVMIIRGACILPKMKNIKIYSIVGHYLEHSRVYVFGIGKSAQVMLGSADLMHRNLSLRNELLINITNPDIRERLMKHLAWYQQDNTHRREILDKYEYRIIEPDKKEKEFDVQQMMQKEAKQLALT